jgi:2-oxoglutarate ferredoxin oxidoreductase subunit beta
MTEATAMKVKVGGLQRSYWQPLQACPGCHHPIISSVIGEVLEEMELDGSAIVVLGVGCTSMIAGLNLDCVLGSHGGAPDIATAIKRLEPDRFVLTMQGDGDCIAIGAGAWIAAMGRGENITIIMANNANYGTTGGQLAPTTIVGQITPTTPDGRNTETDGFPIHAAELAATFQGVAYSARGALNTMANYQRTKKFIRRAFQKQLDREGMSFVEVLSACPPNWHKTPLDSIDWITEKMLREFPVGEYKKTRKAAASSSNQRTTEKENVA